MILVPSNTKRRNLVYPTKNCRPGSQDKNRLGLLLASHLRFEPQDGGRLCFIHGPLRNQLNDANPVEPLRCPLSVLLFNSIC